MLEPAPGLFSTTIGWPSAFDKGSARTRATNSAARPERFIQLDVDDAVALHDHALAAHGNISHAFENLTGREWISGAAVDAHAARAQRRGRLRAAHGDDHA